MSGTIVFDLDGTLADTAADIAAAANAVFRELGHAEVIHPAGDAAIAYNRGGRGMLREGFTRLHGAADEAEVERLFPRLLEHYEAEIATHSVLFPGAAEAIGALREAGYATAICTNKVARLAEILMEELNARHLFDALVGADTLPVRKPDPAPFHAAVEGAGGAMPALMVGDTATDRETARAAGVPCILVTFGAEGHGVAALEPEALLHAYGDLPALVGRLLA